MWLASISHSNQSFGRVKTCGLYQTCRLFGHSLRRNRVRGTCMPLRLHATTVLLLTNYCSPQHLELEQHHKNVSYVIHVTVGSKNKICATSLPRVTTWTVTSTCLGRDWARMRSKTVRYMFTERVFSSEQPDLTVSHSTAGYYTTHDTSYIKSFTITKFRPTRLPCR
jgi:hypothetical protein